MKALLQFTTTSELSKFLPIVLCCLKNRKSSSEGKITETQKIQILGWIITCVLEASYWSCSFWDDVLRTYYYYTCVAVGGGAVTNWSNHR